MGAQRTITIPFLFCMVCVLGYVDSVLGQTFDQLTRPVATLTRPSQIDSFFTELIISPQGNVSYVEVVDVTGNGYGPDDVVIVHPSLEVYPLGAHIPPNILGMMQSWELEADYRLDVTLAEGEQVEADAHTRMDAQGAISGACVSAITRYYSGTDLDFRLERDADGLRLEMWNYDPQAMRYQSMLSAACEGPAAAPWTQRFRFAKPIIVTSFNEPGGCVETRTSDGQVETRPCQ